MVSLDPDRTALIVVDVQRAFDQWEARGQRRNNPQAIERIGDLIGEFRRAKAALFHIRHRSANAESPFSPSDMGYQVKDEAREQDDEPVIVKEVNSAFIGTDLEQRLRTAGIHTIVICGVTTNHCVETTTRMAGNLGFDARLVSDATWTFDRVGPDGRLHRAEDIQAMTESNVSDEFAQVVLTRDVVDGLRTR